MSGSMLPLILSQRLSDVLWYQYRLINRRFRRAVSRREMDRWNRQSTWVFQWRLAIDHHTSPMTFIDHQTSPGTQRCRQDIQQFPNVHPRRRHLLSHGHNHHHSLCVHVSRLLWFNFWCRSSDVVYRKCDLFIGRHVQRRRRSYWGQLIYILEIMKCQLPEHNFFWTSWWSNIYQGLESYVQLAYNTISKPTKCV